jgi:hypothetical protein
MLVLSILDVIHTMADDFRVLDLFDPRVKTMNIAHDSTKEEEEKKPKTFAIESTKDGESRVFEFDIWDIAKYIAIAVGGGYVIHKIFSRKSTKDEGPSSQQMMMSMMFMMYQTNMMIMQSLAPSKKAEVTSSSVVPPAANPSAKPLLEEDDKDWMQFFNENKGKVLNQDQLTQLDKIGIKQNWKVERDLRGTILNVWKVNEYLK